MSKKAKFYHAGCPVCLSAEHGIVDLIDPNKYEVEIVHLGEAKDRVAEAKGKGVQSVPALVLENGNVYHINFGAALKDLG